MAYELYTAEWNFAKPFETIEVEGFEVPVVLPKRPANKYIVNWDKPLSKQKFRREVIPNDLQRWNEKKRDEFVEAMFHKRRNGEWWKIGGRVMYITGKFWYFLNFWWTEAGMYPEFREESLDFFLVWEHCVRDKDCCGLLDIKGRRMGDTEKSLCILYEEASGSRYTWCGMQNVKEDDAKDNFLRIVGASAKIPFFFKPIMPSSSAPTKVMEFRYPEEIFTMNKLRNEKAKGTNSGQGGDLVYKYDPINSKIDYETSVKGRYDGKRLKIWHLDEPGKITAFDVNEQWGIIKPALSLQNGAKIVGKALWTTTVEDFESAQTMQHIKKTWDESDPNDKNANNRTQSGLYRYFRNCVNAYAVDEFGFKLKEECLQRVKNEQAGYEAVTDWDGLAAFNRKHPITIDDVFRPPHNECVLYPVLLDKRMRQIDNGQLGNDRTSNIDGSTVRPLEVAGEFAWTNGFGSKVMWIPNQNGKWRVSHHPDTPNNFWVGPDGLQFPGNIAAYTFGVDPVDHTAEDGQGSDGGGAVFRRFNKLVDNDLALDDDGNIADWEVWRMQTERFVADYIDRPDNPYDYFEEMLKAAIYYGVPIFPEKNRGSIIPWFNDKGFKHFVGWRPMETRMDVASKKQKKFKKEKGMTANPGIIHLYTQELKLHVYKRWPAYHHKRILNDYRQYNVKNRTKRDLTVACGMALLAAMDQKTQKAEEKKSNWNGLPVRKIKRT